MMQASGSSAAAAAGAAAGSSSSAIAPAASAYGSQGSSSQLGGEQALVPDPRHPSGIIPALQNIVSTVNLGCALDLKSIAMRARNAEFNPRKFSAVIMRIRDPKTTALIFHSGKMVVTGARSEELSRLAARKYARIIQKLGFGVSFGDFTVQNMVGTADVRFPVLLDGLARDHEDFTSYEPELFPGLIYRMVSPKVVLLIFVSGKVVMTGAKNRDHIYEAFEYIYPVLTEYRKQVVQFSHNTPGSLQIAAAAAAAAAQPSAKQAAAAAAKAKRAAIKSEKQAASRKKKAADKAAKAGGMAEIAAPMDSQ